MRRMIRVWTVVFCHWALHSQAAVLDPWAFTSLGILNVSETLNINTDMLVLTGGAAYTGVLDPVSVAGIFRTHADVGAADLNPVYKLDCSFFSVAKTTY